ncbi:BREX-1 system adenine-specific DNA-methyltransferase PglX [Methanospirillum sp. J.3.6.1-F.2.7.3]|uniref:site-specific DNA-methyltransferase (adenine-specific) n=1 Tax=Methanospirillum purgamenti TaxID=2834276 RepID=A0A8E7AYM2_9EURY|nr:MULTISPECIES: BREX-1 system adenine-specific DNA-methyltransferase PglX [Methanospirillum]MDX8551921.1 BREX-1 system adenine-specific DNA-methyltransferase PglX [Methanospirillum hungatei]QVV87851.1 BREX-1 system adenine-specific DNA-methyltransferase PglX [Methanospirillum sp. J.3.6.1-F.2.7.3]
MDKAKVQLFSDSLRKNLLEETKKRAAHYGITGKTIAMVEQEFEDSIIIGGEVYPRSIRDQRAFLVKEIEKKGYDRVIEEVTYTWFNRFVAIRFMEVNDYLPARVFSSASAGKTDPDILTKALDLTFLDIDREHVLDLKSDGRHEELFRYLFLRLCNYLHTTMPFLFEPIQDYSELLFPDRLLHTDSMLGDLNTIIPEDDWKETEIIGWIYQDYIAEKKDLLIKAKKQYTVDQIPAVTQLFTPKWIVQYMVENSLGRLWMLNHPHSRLYERMEVYIRPDEQETDFLKISSPEELKVCDPACGSGHILVYAFDLLYEIYKEEGYLEQEIPEFILTHNLYGIEIDKRAGSLAAFALVMKARRMDKKFFDHPVQPHICVLENIELDEEDIDSYITAVGSNLFPTDLRETLMQFTEAENFGSLIQPSFGDVKDIRKILAEKNMSSNLLLFDTHQKVLKVLEQTQFLGMKYHVVVANPPYMGGKGQNNRLKEFAKKYYPDSKSDLFAMFIERNMDLTLKGGYIGMMTSYTWMFLSSYEKLRTRILDDTTIITLVRPEYHAFFESAYVPICSFVLYATTLKEFKGGFIDLKDFYGADIQGPKALEIIKNYNSYLMGA